MKREEAVEIFRYDSKILEIFSFSRYTTLLWICEYVLCFGLIFVTIFWAKKYVFEVVAIFFIFLLCTQGLFVVNKMVFMTLPSEAIIFEGSMVEKYWKPHQRGTVLIPEPSSYNRQMSFEINDKLMLEEGYNQKEKVSFSEDPQRSAIYFDRILAGDSIKVQGKQNLFFTMITSVQWDVKGYNEKNQYEYAQKIYTEGNSIEASEVWLKLAENGDARAAHQAGVSYFYGDGLERDYSKAKNWLGKAKERGVEDPLFNRFFRDNSHRSW